jgi:hypothetical protein
MLLRAHLGGGDRKCRCRGSSGTCRGSGSSPSRRRGRTAGASSGTADGRPCPRPRGPHRPPWDGGTGTCSPPRTDTCPRTCMASGAWRVACSPRRRGAGAGTPRPRGACRCCGTCSSRAVPPIPIRPCRPGTPTRPCRPVPPQSRPGSRSSSPLPEAEHAPSTPPKAGEPFWRTVPPRSPWHLCPRQASQYHAPRSPHRSS